MNKRDNPYTPGAGRKPRTLAGRDQDLESFQSLVERLDAGSYERSLIYTGLRGVGKTVLLMEFDVLASEAGWATTDVQEVGSNADFRTTFAGMANRLLMNMSRRHRAKQRIERALAVVKSFSVGLPGAVSIKLDVDAAAGIADSGDAEQDLAGLFREIGEVAQANQMGALFLIDEMQNLDTPSLSAICMAFQGISRAGLPVAMVGAGLPDLRVRLLSAKPYADRLFSYEQLGRLSEGAARSALIGPAAAAGADYDEEAARQIVHEAAGFPYFIQEYGRELWNFAETTPITAGRSRQRPGDRQGQPGPQLLRHSLRDGHRHRAALPLGHGVTRGRAVPSRRSCPRLWSQRPTTRVHASRVADPEGSDLEPTARTGRFHGAAVCGVPEGEPPGVGPVTSVTFARGGS